MDKLSFYRQVLKDIFSRHAQYKPSSDQCDVLSIFEEASDNFLLIDVGWRNSRRIHDVILHVRIIAEKVQVEWDGIESGITKDLLAAGVPSEDIVLGFVRPERRQLIDFSAA